MWQRALDPANAEKSNATLKESKLTELDFRACLREGDELFAHTRKILRCGAAEREHLNSVREDNTQCAHGAQLAEYIFRQNKVFFRGITFIHTEKTCKFLFIVMCGLNTQTQFLFLVFLCQCVGVHQQTESR